MGNFFDPFDGLFDGRGKIIYYYSMKQWVFLLITVFLFAISCASDQPAEEKYPDPPMISEPVETVQVPAAPVEQTPAEQTPVEPVPEPVQAEPEKTPEPLPLLTEPVYVATQEEFDTTKADIQQLVEDLNRIIRAGNYNSWLTYLSDEYRSSINSKEFLDDIKNRYPVFRTRINNARDYFNNVVVPSRANDHVDDIDFSSRNEVIAYTLDNNGRRLVLYHLVNIDGKWKIAN